jgi:hypothetical protein
MRRRISIGLIQKCFRRSKASILQACARMKKLKIDFLLVLAIIILVNPKTSWAYVDPNTVGFATQFLAPLGTLLLSCMIYFRRKVSGAMSSGWRWLRGRLVKLRPDDSNC